MNAEPERHQHVLTGGEATKPSATLVDYCADCGNAFDFRDLWMDLATGTTTCDTCNSKKVGQ
jgi:hypothetical protein